MPGWCGGTGVPVTNCCNVPLGQGLLRLFAELTMEYLQVAVPLAYHAPARGLPTGHTPRSTAGAQLPCRPSLGYTVLPRSYWW